MIEAANSGDAKAKSSFDTFKKMAINLRVDEQMGIVVPSDTWQGVNGPSPQRMFHIELLTPTGGRGGSMNFEVAIQTVQYEYLDIGAYGFLDARARGARHAIARCYKG